jgi:hypothetical protein
LSVHACKKISSYFDIDGLYMLHKPIEAAHIAITKLMDSQGFCDSYEFRCHIGLKLFLRLARATGEGTTKFGIFLRWFGTFSCLIKLPRDGTD